MTVVVLFMMTNCMNQCRMACSIQFPDQVVVTGGIYSTNRVVVYGAENFISYLPELLVGRYDHGCTSFYNEDDELVSLSWVQSMEELSMEWQLCSK